MSNQTREEFWEETGRWFADLARRIPYEYPEIYQRILEARKKKAEAQEPEGSETETPQDPQE